MKVTFCMEDDRLWQRDREVSCLPQECDTVVWHGLDGDRTRQFVVVEVLHAYDDRTWYKERPEDFGDRVYVMMRRKEET